MKRLYQVEISANCQAKAESPAQLRARLLRFLRREGFEDKGFQISIQRGEAPVVIGLNAEEKALLGLTKRRELSKMEVVGQTSRGHKKTTKKLRRGRK